MEILILFSKHRFVFFPLAFEAPEAVWTNNILPLTLLQSTDTTCSFVNHDGIKTMAGTVATPIHYDGRLSQLDDPIQDAPYRVQAILIDEVVSSRHLKVIPNTPAIRTLLGEIAGTGADKKRLFNTLRQPELSTLLHRHGQHYPIGPHVLVFIAGTIHFETLTGDKRAPLFRVYCGWTKCTPESVCENERISLLFYALHGYTIDSFSRCPSPLFVFERTTQFYSVRDDRVDTILHELQATTLAQRREYVLSHATPMQLRLAGLHH